MEGKRKREREQEGGERVEASEGERGKGAWKLSSVQASARWPTPCVSRTRSTGSDQGKIYEQTVACVVCMVPGMHATLPCQTGVNDDKDDDNTRVLAIIVMTTAHGCFNEDNADDDTRVCTATPLLSSARAFC